jgi:hypothetical protein
VAPHDKVLLSGTSFAVVDSTGEQTVLSAADERSQLGWIDAIQFNSLVVGAPWRDRQFSRSNLLSSGKAELNAPAAALKAADASATSVNNGDGAADAGSDAKQILTRGDIAAERSESAGRTDAATAETSTVSAEITAEESAVVPLANFDSSAERLTAASRGDAIDAIDTGKIEALRDMVGSKLRRMCTDMMKGASTKPSGPDPSAAALVLGQNFLCVYHNLIMSLLPSGQLPLDALIAFIHPDESTACR